MFLGSMSKGSVAYDIWMLEWLSLKQWTRLPRVLEKFPPIFTAAYYGFYRILSDLWELGYPDINQRHNNVTLLSSAVDGGHLPVVQWLVSAGADVNAKSGLRNNMPLIVAVKNCHFESAKVLLEAGAHIDGVKTEIGTTTCTLLEGSYYNEDIPMMQLLIEYGATLDNGAIFKAAARDGKKEMVLFLRPGVFCNFSYTYYHIHALTAAAGNDHTTIMQLLVSA
jgi:ankyrin repeat protein